MRSLSSSRSCGGSKAGQVKLDEAILSYERGAQLKQHCERKLNESAAKGRSKSLLVRTAP